MLQLKCLKIIIQSLLIDDSYWLKEEAEENCKTKFGSPPRLKQANQNKIQNPIYYRRVQTSRNRVIGVGTLNWQSSIDNGTSKGNQACLGQAEAPTLWSEQCYKSGVGIGTE